MVCVALSFILFATCAAELPNPDDEALSMFQTRRARDGPVANDDIRASIVAGSDQPITHTPVRNDKAGLDELTNKLGPLPDRPDDWLMNTPIETFVAHATAAIYGLGGGATAKLTEAYLHFYRDFNNKFVAIETIVKGALEATDQFVLYRRNDECVLVVSGTDDLYDAGQDINVQKVPACGTMVHEGMYLEAMRINQALFKLDNLMLNYFTGPKCKKRYTSGHSLGGAVIEFMTTCLSPLKDMELDAAFSFGAPGISEDPIPVDKELTFPTYRFWNTDSSLTTTVGMDSFDMIPWILEGLHGLGHPKYRSIEIEHTGNSTYVKHEMTPDEEGATEEPTGNLGMPRMSLHMYWVYEDGVAFIYGK